MDSAATRGPVVSPTFVSIGATIRYVISASYSRHRRPSRASIARSPPSWLGNAETAVTAVEQGLAALPDDENMRFGRARALLARGDVQAARAELRALVAARPSWEIVLRSYATKNRLTVPQAISIDALLE
jgi:hypothetical protein